MGFPGGASGKESACQRRRHLLCQTWVWFLDWEDSPGAGNGNPLQYSCLENPMDRGAWQVCGCKESGMPECLSTGWPYSSHGVKYHLCGDDSPIYIFSLISILNNRLIDTIVYLTTKNISNLTCLKLFPQPIPSLVIPISGNDSACHYSLFSYSLAWVN